MQLGLWQSVPLVEGGIGRGSESVAQTIRRRNDAWLTNPYIPSWVRLENVGLDQFFTRPEVALQCWQSLLEYMASVGAPADQFKFIEPSAGTGSFYKLLPKSQRVGIDLQQFDDEYICADFLGWLPPATGQRFVCVGNPPFGYRAWLALAFLNHAAKFSDLAAFILPMAFQSRGKGNPQDRVRGMTLVHSSLLPADSFFDVGGKSPKVNALWQIWSRGEARFKTAPKTCNQYIDLFTVDMRKERLCGRGRMHEASFFLQRTFYSDPPALVVSFDQVRYVCGYGIVIKKDAGRVLEVLRGTNWVKYSNLASHGCRHISMCHIRAALTEAGLVDD